MKCTLFFQNIYPPHWKFQFGWITCENILSNAFLPKPNSHSFVSKKNIPIIAFRLVCIIRYLLYYHASLEVFFSFLVSVHIVSHIPPNISNNISMVISLSRPLQIYYDQRVWDFLEGVTNMQAMISWILNSPLR